MTRQFHTINVGRLKTSIENAMDGFKDYFSTASDAYRRFRPQYPAALFDYLRDLAPTTGWAWDCGCGNGQASVALAQRFQRVTATDASAEQIKQAPAVSNIDYRVACAETIDAPEESLDLITVAQAIHWFNHAEFFAEVIRSLKPGGVLAVWGYQLFNTGSALDATIEKFYSTVVGPYWPPERALLDENFAGIEFPYPPIETPVFQMQCRWTFDHVIGYLKTWSAAKRYHQDRGVDPVESYLAHFRRGWGDLSREKTVVWPLLFYAGAKPADK